MSVRPILKMGDTRLLVPAQSVRDVRNAEVLALIRDMRDSMIARDGAGLAAPQIGIPLRIIMFGGRENPRYPDAGLVPETVLINPELTILDKSVTYDWEGCLSLPGLHGRVPRFRRVRYRGMDVAGEVIERTVTGFHARVVQHECDHLDGILFPMRMDDMSRFGFEDALAACPASGDAK